VKFKIRMTKLESPNEIRMTNDEWKEPRTKEARSRQNPAYFVCGSSHFVIRHSEFAIRH